MRKAVVVLPAAGLSCRGEGFSCWGRPPRRDFPSSDEYQMQLLSSTFFVFLLYSNSFVWQFLRRIGSILLQNNIIRQKKLFNAVAFYAVAFITVALYAAAFYAVVFYAVAFYAVAFYSVAFYAIAFYALTLYAVAFSMQYSLQCSSFLSSSFLWKRTREKIWHPSESCSVQAYLGKYCTVDTVYCMWYST